MSPRLVVVDPDATTREELRDQLNAAWPGRLHALALHALALPTLAGADRAGADVIVNATGARGLLAVLSGRGA